MNVLLIGDITGSPGREIVRRLLPRIKKTESIDFVIANAENVAGGSGITPGTADELFDSGVDVLTSGDHIWKQKEVLDIIETETRILRPANYPKSAPGAGCGVFTAANAVSVGVINLLGRVFMQPVDCPFRAATECVEKIKEKTKIIFVDMHAEATSEKVALGWYLDGKVSCVFGTHTHVQTADEKILPRQSAYITDLGMTGPFDSVIGRKKEQVLERFLTQMPVRFQVAEGDVRLNGAIVSVDDKTGTATSIRRVQIARS
ncbi:MAG: TIGR00282 family metallophosphoesterase [Candidatus Omnitrophica bacterium]|nr:TIGR00282 family metallophosphoesterase [Candidatus Omnitrophota bacterium]